MKIYRFGIALAAIAFASCSSSGDDTTNDLPAGAEQISSEDFDSGVAAGTIIQSQATDQASQEAAGAAAEADDDAIIAEINAETPAALVLTDANDPVVRPSGDGNWLHDVLMEDGSTRSYVTHGLRIVKSQAAAGVRAFRTRENQFTTYKNLYDSLPERARIAFQLPEPADVAEPRYTQPIIRDLNNDLIVKWRDSGLSIPPVFVAGKPASCDDEQGARDPNTNTVAAGDRSGNGACVHKASGVYNNFEFYQRENLTCVKDQAARGTCVSFSNAAAFEYQIAKTHSRWVNLSEQYQYSRFLFTWDRRDYGDGYDSFRSFGKMVAEGFRLPFEYQWNYNPSNSRTAILGKGADGIAGTKDDPIVGYNSSCTGYGETCSNTTHQVAYVCTNAATCGYVTPNKNPANTGWQVGQYSELFDATDRNLSTLKVAVATIFGAPVLLGIPVTPSWDGASADGFMTYAGASETSRGGHQVLVVGYVTNQQLSDAMSDAGKPAPPVADGGGYFIIKNSWSACFKDGGYIYAPWNWMRDYMYTGVALHSVVE